MRGLECAFVGRLAREPERRETKAGAPMTVLLVAVDEPSAENDAVQWVKVLVFHDQADAAAALAKGCEVYCEGRLRLETWTGRDGQPKAGLTVLARLVQPLGRIGRRRPRQARSNGAREPARAAQTGAAAAAATHHQQAAPCPSQRPAAAAAGLPRRTSTEMGSIGTGATGSRSKGPVAEPEGGAAWPAGM